MRPLALPFLLLAVAGCPKQPAPMELPPGPLDIYAPPPRHEVVFTERIAIANLHLGDVTVRQVWEGPSEEDGLRVWQVTEIESDERGERVRERFEVFYGPGGMGYLGSVAQAEGEPVRWDPPQVVLPANPVPGRAWSVVHTRGDRESERSCELMSSELCDGGVVSVCESRPETGLLVMRDHFCPGVGWSGYEALLLRDEGAMRRWTEQVIRDGVPVQ